MKKVSRFKHFVRSVCTTFILFAVVITLVLIFRNAYVVGDSMNPTLHNGDLLILQSTASLPTDGKIVVLQSDRIAEATGAESLKNPLIKRVIAREGEYISIFDNGQTVYVSDHALEFDLRGAYYTDGEGNRIGVLPLDEPYINRDVEMTSPDVKNHLVAEGCVYVLGDNRGNSRDSRYFGDVTAEEILGRILIRVFPFSGFGKIESN